VGWEWQGWKKRRMVPAGSETAKSRPMGRSVSSSALDTPFAAGSSCVWSALSPFYQSSGPVFDFALVQRTGSTAELDEGRTLSFDLKAELALSGQSDRRRVP
jgi:hypothetical protein